MINNLIQYKHLNSLQTEVSNFKYFNKSDHKQVYIILLHEMIPNSKHNFYFVAQTSRLESHRKQNRQSSLECYRQNLSSRLIITRWHNIKVSITS